MQAMQLPVPLLALVLFGVVCAQDAPRITVVNEDIGVPKAEEAAAVGVPPGGEAMQQMLNWAINNSDPERLKELMVKYKEQNLTVKDVYGQEFIDAMFVNEGSVLKEMSTNIADFANASVTDDDLEDSLTRLQELVEQVDNAGNLHRNGGLKPLLELGVSDALVSSQPVEVIRSEPVRSLALWTLGVAVQNNEPVQAELLEIGGLPLLIRRLLVCSGGEGMAMAGSEYCGKLIFAISGLVKNNETIQNAADSEGLFEWLLDIGLPHPLPAIAKKSMALLDIALSQSPNLHFLSTLPAKQDIVATSLLAHIGGKPPAVSHNFDSAEKGLRLVNRLLSLRPMLFRPTFRAELAEAVSSASKDCEQTHGAGEELCEGFNGLAKHADLALAARELGDDDL